MSELGDTFRYMNEVRKEQHEIWKESNTRLIKSSGIPHLMREEAILFREEGMPQVDFYPSTGRWRVKGVKRTFRGQAGPFLKWYRKHYKEAK